MIIQFQFFPEREEEIPSHTMTFDLPGLPQAGDRVTVTHPGQEGYTSYEVRRRVWDLDCPTEGAPRADDPAIGQANAVIVECVFMVGPYVSEEHRGSAPHPT